MKCIDNALYILTIYSLFPEINIFYLCLSYLHTTSLKCRKIFKLWFCMSSTNAEWLTYLLHDVTWNKTMWWGYWVAGQQWLKHLISCFCPKQGRTAPKDYVCCLSTQSVSWLSLIEICIEDLNRTSLEVFSDTDAISYPTWMVPYQIHHIIYFHNHFFIRLIIHLY